MEKANKLGRRDSYYTLRQTHNKCTFYLNGKSHSLVLINSKKLYWELVETIQVDPSARHKYSSIFNN